MADNYNTLVLMFGQGTSFGGTEVDYDRFMEEFKRDYGQQIDLTAEQLKQIVNSKNVNGKGEKLADAVRTILENRLDKTIEKNRKEYSSQGHVLSPEILKAIECYAQPDNCLEDEPEEALELTADMPAEPEVAEKVETVSEPEVSAEPEAVSEPEVSVEVETVPEPEVPVEVETVLEPEAVAEPVREVGTEFLRYGVTAELEQEYTNTENPYVCKLLSALTAYEEAMELMNPSAIQKAVSTVKDTVTEINAAEEKFSDKAFGEFVAKLEAEFKLGDINDIPELTKWCLSHHKVGQAAVVYARLMPDYLFDNKVLYYENFHENKLGDGSYGDKVIDAGKQAKSQEGLKYFWLNEMLWKSAPKKLFLNVDKAIGQQDGTNTRRFKEVFHEIKELQETKKNHVAVEDVSEELRKLMELVSQKHCISPVLNTTKKVCNYFFNYETAGAAGSVQKTYRELSCMLLTNREFCEEYFGEESERLVTFTPASFLMNKEEKDVHSSFDAWKVEKILRMYDTIKGQAECIGRTSTGTAKRMTLRELEGTLAEAVEMI
jgi:hypothetical protein